MKRKWLAIGIILLFTGTCIISVIAQKTEEPLPTLRGNWLYVGGSGPGNYTKIQDAINDSNNGDTVFVYDESSPYIERLTINNGIMLIGEDQATTFIHTPSWEFNDSVITIRAANSSIRGFTLNAEVFGITILAANVLLTNLCIQGGDDSGIRFIYAENTVISQITVIGADSGVERTHDGYSSNITIEHCSFLNCTSFGIAADSSEYIICDNTVISCPWGIIVDNNGNKIVNNTIIGGGPNGIYVDSKNSIIIGNSLTQTGFRVISLTGNIFANNTVNGKPFVYFVYADNQTIDNAGQVLLVGCSHMSIKNLEIGWCQNGIFLYETTNSHIQNCTMTTCREGIVLWHSSYNRIQNSTMTGCLLSGINMNYGFNNTIDNNRLTGCDIVIAFSSNNLVCHNKLNKNNITLDTGSYNIIEQNTLNSISLENANYSIITQNNFIKIFKPATFTNGLYNNWTQNYWGRPINHPKIILGHRFLFDFDWPYWGTTTVYIRWINIDWHPAKEPYDIPGMV